MNLQAQFSDLNLEGFSEEKSIAFAPFEQLDDLGPKMLCRAFQNLRFGLQGRCAVEAEPTAATARLLLECTEDAMTQKVMFGVEQLYQHSSGVALTLDEQDDFAALRYAKGRLSADYVKDMLASVGLSVEEKAALGGQCFPGEVDLLTGSGPKKIRDVVVGDLIKDGTGKWVKVLCWIHKEPSQLAQFVVLKHTNGNIKTTHNHLIFVNGGGSKLAGDVIPGD